MFRTRPISGSGPLGQHQADGYERGQSATAGGRLASFESADRPEEQSAPPWGLGEAVKGRAQSVLFRSVRPMGSGEAVKGEGKESLPSLKPR